MSRARPKLDQPNFDDWMKLANEALELKFAVSVNDLPHKLWAAWYEEGLSPGAAATLAMEEEGFALAG